MHTVYKLALREFLATVTVEAYGGSATWSADWTCHYWVMITWLFFGVEFPRLRWSNVDGKELAVNVVCHFYVCRCLQLQSQLRNYCATWLHSLARFLVAAVILLEAHCGGVCSVSAYDVVASCSSWRSCCSSSVTSLCSFFQSAHLRFCARSWRVTGEWLPCRMQALILSAHGL